MPSSEEHLTTGIIAGTIAYAGYKLLKGEEIKKEGVLKSALTGGLFALAPDFLEPATNPNHRAFLHSITAIISGGYGSYKEIHDNRVDDSTKELIIAAFSGYSSHLLTDSFTPKSIPLI